MNAPVALALVLPALCAAIVVMGCGDSKPACGKISAAGTGGVGVPGTGGSGISGSGGRSGTGGGGASGTAGASGSGGGGVSGTAGASATGGISGMGGGSGAGSGGALCDCPDVSGAPLGVAMHPSEGQAHTASLCDPVCYGTLPPSSGTHYGAWPVYKTYAAPIPWGFMVHALEHGAVEVTYNCPDGCPAEVAAAQAWIDALPPNQGCAGAPQVVLAPEPSLDVRWAAAAWQWTLRANAFVPADFQSFFDDHYAHGPEGGILCGAFTDLSATGWCP